MVKSKRSTFGNLEGEVKQAKNVSALIAVDRIAVRSLFDLDTVNWVRKLWQRKLILKGIMHVDDARHALDVGADAIIVSNHGGRQLDGAPSSISVLPDIVRRRAAMTSKCFSMAASAPASTSSRPSAAVPTRASPDALPLWACGEGSSRRDVRAQPAARRIARLHDAHRLTRCARHPG